jgi:pyruvate ferredoxin oxidoreductase delta subunit
MVLKIDSQKKHLPKKGYKTMVMGGIIEKAGNSLEYITGDWRVKYPYLDKKICINCLICYIYCPEKCIEVDDDKIGEINLKYCKGCGICATECTKGAIRMIKNSD